MRTGSNDRSRLGAPVLTVPVPIGSPSSSLSKMPGVTLQAKAGPAQEFGQVRVDDCPVVIAELASRLAGGQAGQAVLASRSAWLRVGQAARAVRPGPRGRPGDGRPGQQQGRTAGCFGRCP